MMRLALVAGGLLLSPAVAQDVPMVRAPEVLPLPPPAAKHSGYFALPGDPPTSAIGQEYIARAPDAAELVEAWPMIKAALEARPDPANGALVACKASPSGCEGRFTRADGLDPGVALLGEALGDTPATKAVIAAKAERLLQTYYRAADALGLERDNVGAAMTYALLVSTEGRGKRPTSEIARNKAAALYPQLQGILATDLRMAVRNDRERQTLYEMVGIFGVALVAAYQDALADADLARQGQLRETAFAIFKPVTGFSPYEVEIGAGGFQSYNTYPPPSAPRRRAGTPTTEYDYKRKNVLDPQKSALVTRFNQLIENEGGDPEDIAWGITEAFKIYFLISHEVLMDRVQLDRSYTLIRDLLLESDSATFPDRDKQQGYELLAARMMDSLLQYRDLLSQSPVDRAAIAKVRTATRAVFDEKLNRFTVDDFKLTPDGLVKVR